MSSILIEKSIDYTITKRLRRNRKSAAIRELVRETQLLRSDFIVPFFLIDGENQRQTIQTMPGIERLSLDLILKKAEHLHKQGIQAIAIFPVMQKDLKDSFGSEALNADGLVLQAVRTIKSEIPSLCVITDIALDPFTSHGHDGVVNDKGDILNDPTIEILTKMACLHAESGVDIVAPSDMMDGRVQEIRRSLDKNNFQDVGILSYSAKYASALYAPFREALGSAPAFGDKKTYQMDPANSREALLEAHLDEEEGADILMVKPASLYLDIISMLREKTNRPIAAYHVSGEYAMVMASEHIFDVDKIFYETLIGIKRAGADMIFTYAAERLINNNFL